MFFMLKSNVDKFDYTNLAERNTEIGATIIADFKF